MKKKNESLKSVKDFLMITWHQSISSVYSIVSVCFCAVVISSGINKGLSF